MKLNLQPLLAPTPVVRVVEWVVGGALAIVIFLVVFGAIERAKGRAEAAAAVAHAPVFRDSLDRVRNVAAGQAAAVTSAVALRGHAGAVARTNVAIRSTNAAVTTLEADLAAARKAQADSGETLLHARAQRDSLATGALEALAAFKVERAGWLHERDSTARVIATQAAQRSADSLTIAGDSLYIRNQATELQVTKKALACRVLFWPCPSRTVIAVVSVGVAEVVRALVTKKP